MYRVIEYFIDLQDANREYYPGETYPRDGYKPTAARIAELSGAKNLRRVPLIQKAEAPKKPTKRKKKGE